MVEAVSGRQMLLSEPVEVCVKGVLRDWDVSSLTEFPTETWMVHCSNRSDQAAAVFQRVLSDFSSHSMHMVRWVSQNNLIDMG